MGRVRKEMVDIARHSSGGGGIGIDEMNAVDELVGIRRDVVQVQSIRDIGNGVTRQRVAFLHDYRRGVGLVIPDGDQGWEGHPNLVPGTVGKGTTLIAGRDFQQFLGIKGQGQDIGIRLTHGKGLVHAMRRSGLVLGNGRQLSGRRGIEPRAQIGIGTRARSIGEVVETGRIRRRRASESRIVIGHGLVHEGG